LKIERKNEKKEHNFIKRDRMKEGSPARVSFSTHSMFTILNLLPFTMMHNLINA